MNYKKSHCAATKFMLCITLYDIAILKGKLKKRLQGLKKTKQTTGKSVNQHRGKENRKKKQIRMYLKVMKFLLLNK